MGVLVQVEQLSKSYGTHILLDGASLSIAEGQKIGCIGRNGAGKTTFLKIMIGELKADQGRVIHHPGLRLGYLDQHQQFAEGETGKEFLLRMSEKPDWECAKLASQFQLTANHLELRATELSGGYQMRLKLTAILLKDPNLLLLDEPTNFLDLSTVLLLERFLQNFKYSCLIVSHDREFLKNTCTHTLEIERGQLSLYPRDIEEYMAFKEEQLEYQKNFNKNVEAQRKHLQAFVDRFRAKASKATQAQSKLKQLQRLETIEIGHSLKTVRIHIPQVERKKSFSLRTSHLTIGYADRAIAREIEFEVQRGDHVAIVGENGQGKSTFLKTIAGELEPLEGSFCWGNRMSIAYYAQHVMQMLHDNDTVGNYLERSAGDGVVREEVLRMAGNFLFSVDDLTKHISVLSGGERARLCLAGILLRRPDVLLLDEPTNHLDFETVEALGEALAEFNGTIFFISHSRTFVHQIANTMIEVQSGEVKRYPFTYEEYVYHLRERLGAMRQDISEEVTDTISEKRQLFEEIAELRKQIKKMEKALEEYGKEKAELMQAFLDHPLEYSRERTERLNTIETVLRHTEDQWLEHQTKLQQAEDKRMYLQETEKDLS